MSWKWVTFLLVITAAQIGLLVAILVVVLIRT